MKSFFDESGSAVSAGSSVFTTPGLPVVDTPQRDHSASVNAEIVAADARRSISEARIAVYDSLTAAPRVESVAVDDTSSFIDALAARVFGLAKESGGCVPFTVVRELTENYIHAGFEEAVVTVLDGGNTIRFSDQGPGIPDKERVFSPGFSTASKDMKRVIKGVGSGLPIAKECLQFSGGSISVEDNLGRGTVVTVRMDKQVSSPIPAASEGGIPSGPRLSMRQKQVLSLVMELGSVGPTVAAKELGVGLSTAYRDLASLEDLGLLMCDESGKRVLTQDGVSSLDKLLYM